MMRWKKIVILNKAMKRPMLKKNNRSPSSPEGKAKKIVLLVKQSKAAKYLLAISILITAFRAFLGFSQDLLTDGKDAYESILILGKEVSKLKSAISGEPLDLAVAYADDPAAFEQGVVFSRPVFLKGTLNISGKNFKFEAPKFECLPGCAISGMPPFKQDESPVFPKPLMVAIQYGLKKGAVGYAGKNGDPSPDINISAKTFAGKLNINNSGGNGTSGGPGQKAQSAEYDAQNGRIVRPSSVAGDPGRGGDGGDAGSVMLGFDEILPDSTINVRAKGGFGGAGGDIWESKYSSQPRDYNMQYFGGSGYDGYIRLGTGSKARSYETGKLFCRFSHKEPDSSSGRSDWVPPIYDPDTTSGYCSPW